MKNAPGFNSSLVRLKELISYVKGISHNFGFNSSLVRLKDGGQTAAKELETGFNSSLVRLKAHEPAAAVYFTDLVSIPVWCD